MHRAQGWAIAGGALAWMAGVGLQVQQAVLWPESAYAACGLLALGLAAAAWRWAASRLAVALVMAGMALAGLGSTGWRAAERLAAQHLDPGLEGADLVLTGRVADMPQVDADGLRFLFVVSEARRGDQPVAVPERLWLGWGRGWQEDSSQAAAPAPLSGGERWLLPVRLRRPHGAMNPEGFDAELWLFEQGVGAVGSVRPTAQLPPVRLAAARAWVPAEALPALRQHWRDAVLLQGGDGRSSGVLAALAVGDQSAIDGPGWELFRQTGVAHLMSISGLHITLFAWLAAHAVGGLWRRSAGLVHRMPAPLAARWGGLVLAAAYSALAGWGVPAQRTVWMLALTVVLRSVGLRWPPLLVCLVAGAGVSLADPWALLQPGFWLSFMAVSLLMSSEPVRRLAAPSMGAAGPWARLRKAVRGGVHAQVVASLGLAPLSMVCFQQLSLVGLLANLVAVPVVTFLVTPLALAGLLWSPLLQAATWALRPVMAWLQLLSGLGWAVWPVPAVPAWAGAAALVGAALLVMPLPRALRLMAPLWMLPLLWPALQRPQPGHFELVAADVGQGSAVLVRTAGHLLVHDAGPQYARDSDAGRRVLLPLLQARGERQIDELVLSHRDTDHVGGAAALLDRLPVSRQRSSLPAAHPLRRPNVPQLDCAAGQAWVWDGVRFEVLHPAQGSLDRGEKPNAVSCVLRVQDAEGRSALLTGDIEAPQEAELVQRLGPALHSDVLIVPHHGSHTSSSPALLQAVAPRWAVIQVGYRSRFGHPHADVLARYRDFGIEVVRTDQCGAWWWDDAGARCTRDVRRRYWHWSTVPVLP